MIFRLFKRIALILALCTVVNNIASAQTIIPANEAPKYVGKVVSLLEMAYTVKYFPSSNTCLVTFPYPGTRDNSPIITIVFHDVSSAKRVRWLKSLHGKWLNVTGRLLVNKGDFIINGNDLHTKVSEFFGMIEVPEVPPPSDTTQQK